MRIGFLGLGTMGAPMAKNLVKAGHAVTVWNRGEGPRRALAQAGAQAAASAREAAAGRQLVVVCVSDEAALRAVLAGPDGAVAGLARGDVLVDCSTVGPAAAREARSLVEAKGAHFAAAPLLGSRGAAEAAQLTIVAGGPRAALDRARPALAQLGAKLVEQPDAEKAQLLKVAVNAVGGAMMAGFAEALTLAVSGGVRAADLVEALQSCGFRSPLYEMKAKKILAGDYAPDFALALAEKDQRLAQEAAAAQGAKLPVNAAVRALFAQAAAGGRGALDLCAVAELLLERAGVRRDASGKLP